MFNHLIIFIAVLLSFAFSLPAKKQDDLICGAALACGIAFTISVFLALVTYCNLFFLKQRLLSFLPPFRDFFVLTPRPQFFPRVSLPKAIIFDSFGDHNVDISHSFYLLWRQIRLGSRYIFFRIAGKSFIQAFPRNFYPFLLIGLFLTLIFFASRTLIFLYHNFIPPFDFDLYKRFLPHIKSIEFWGLKIEFSSE